MAVSEQASGNPVASNQSNLTLSWFAKRSALWLLFVSMGVGAACALYAVAGEPDPVQTAKPAVPATTASIPKG